MPEKKLTDLFYDMLKGIYFAERQILKNLPKMAKAAHSEDRKKAGGQSQRACAAVLNETP